MTDIETGLHYPIDIDNIPENWITDFVSEYATEVQSGFACGRHNSESLGIAHLRPMNVSREGSIDLSDLRFIPAEYDDRRLSTGDVLFNNTNSPELIGKTAFVGKDGDGLAFSNHMTRLRFNAAVEPKFAAIQFHFLWAMKYFLHRCVKHVNQASVSSREFGRSVPIVVPPLKEQCRIVAKVEELFSELDKGVESLKTAREQLKVYRQAVLKHAFEGKLTAQWREGNKDKLETPEQLLARIKKEREARYQQQLSDWEEEVKEWEARGELGPKPGKPSQFKESRALETDELSVLPCLPNGWSYVRLAEISEIGSGMSVSKSRKLQDPIQVSYLRVANVQRGRLELDQITTMNIERSQLSRLSLSHWDVLFNEGGDRDKLGRGWIWESQITPCITQNHVFRASAYIPSETHAKFVSHWGNTFGQIYFDREGKQTTNLASINKTVLSEFPVPLPSFEEQRQIVMELDAQLTVIDQLETEIANSLLRLDALRQSILQKAFSGKLVAQDPNDEPASMLLERIKTEKEECAKSKKNNKSNKNKKKKDAA